MSSLCSAAVQIGEVLDHRYRIVRRLGEGAAGSVFAADDLTRGGLVAIKVLKPTLFGEHMARERFRREIQATMRIQCDYIVRTLGVGYLVNGFPFMVMEYHDGYDLARAIAERGVMPLERAVEHALQVCIALAHTHRVGIVHRDIKPANLLLARRSDGREVVRVMDFGISKIAPNDLLTVPTKLTGNAVRLGSPGYMSPEQRTLGRDVDERTDIWSLGITLFEMIAGVVPFDSNPQSLRAGSESLSTVPSLSRHCSGIPPAFDRVIARCLQHSPDLRFQNVVELAEALAPFDVGSEGRAKAREVAEVLGKPRRTSESRSLVPSLSLSGFGPGNTLGPAVAHGLAEGSRTSHRHWWVLLPLALAVIAVIVLARPHRSEWPGARSLGALSAMPADPAWMRAARAWDRVLPAAGLRPPAPSHSPALGPRPLSTSAVDRPRALPDDHRLGDVVMPASVHPAPSSSEQASPPPTPDVGY